jgi:hypothetical protein
MQEYAPHEWTVATRVVMAGGDDLRSLVKPGADHELGRVAHLDCSRLQSDRFSQRVLRERPKEPACDTISEMTHDHNVSGADDHLASEGRSCGRLNSNP